VTAAAVTAASSSSDGGVEGARPCRQTHKQSTSMCGPLAAAQSKEAASTPQQDTLGHSCIDSKNLLSPKEWCWLSNCPVEQLSICC
jgi:hypothetical protein